MSSAGTTGRRRTIGGPVASTQAMMLRLGGSHAGGSGRRMIGAGVLRMRMVLLLQMVQLVARMTGARLHQRQMMAGRQIVLSSGRCSRCRCSSCRRTATTTSRTIRAGSTSGASSTTTGTLRLRHSGLRLRQSRRIGGRILLAHNQVLLRNVLGLLGLRQQRRIRAGRRNRERQRGRNRQRNARRRGGRMMHAKLMVRMMMVRMVLQIEMCRVLRMVLRMRMMHGMMHEGGIRVRMMATGRRCSSGGGGGRSGSGERMLLVERVLGLL